MLGKKNRIEPAPEKERNVGAMIGEGIVIEEGVLSGLGTVRIDGHFIGRVNLKGHLMVGESGTVDGEIITQSALFAGKFNGDIKASGEVHLVSTAVVTGVIESKTIIMDENAIFNGTCKMAQPAARESAEAAVSGGGAEAGEELALDLPPSRWQAD